MLNKDEQIDLLLELNQFKNDKIEELEADLADTEDDFVDAVETVNILKDALEMVGMKVVFIEDECDCEECKCGHGVSRIFGVIE